MFKSAVRGGIIRERGGKRGRFSLNCSKRGKGESNQQIPKGKGQDCGKEGRFSYLTRGRKREVEVRKASSKIKTGGLVP